MVPSCRLQAMQGNSDCRKASSLLSRSLKNARPAFRNSLLWIICARAATAILLYSKPCNADVLRDQGVGKGGGALLLSQTSHRCVSGSDDGSRWA